MVFFGMHCTIIAPREGVEPHTMNIGKGLGFLAKIENDEYNENDYAQNSVHHFNDQIML